MQLTVKRNLKDLSYLFYGCSSLISLDIFIFQGIDVTDMSYMFYNCSSLGHLPDISNGK